MATLKQLKKRFKIKITPADQVKWLLEEVHEGVYGTKNRAKLILKLSALQDELKNHK